MVKAVRMLLWMISTTLTHAHWPHGAHVAAAGRTETSQREKESITSTTAVGRVSGSQRASPSSDAAETQPFELLKGGVLTHSNPISSSTAHGLKPAEPVSGVSNSISLPGPPATLPQHEETADDSAHVLSGQHIRAAGGDWLRFNKHCGLSLLFLAAVLWLVQFGLKHHPAVQELEGAYDGPPHRSTLGTASHLLNSRQTHSVLLLLAMLPFWQGLALAGAMRLLVCLYKSAQKQHSAGVGIPRRSGLVELLAFFAIVLGQEMPLDFKGHILGINLRALAPGLLAAGLLLLAVSSYNIAQWRKRRRGERHTERPVLQLGQPPAAIAGSGL